MIRVEGLVNRFGGQIVHDGLSFEVRAHEIMGVVGGSGTGKTVLLRTILGLHQPQAGSVEVLRPEHPRALGGGAPCHVAQLRGHLPERGADQLLERRPEYPVAAARSLFDAGGRPRRAGAAQLEPGGSRARRRREISLRSFRAAW